MKPGMQRDILVAYWLLFDEFVVEQDVQDAVDRAEAERQLEAKAEPSARKPD